jgi:creatinine amidohydrolase
MEWTKITSVELKQACIESGSVCLLPFGCLERHSDHLPLGTDSLLACKLACLAAEKETAVVFPPQHYMMVASAAAQPGAIVFDAGLSMTVVETLLAEISRNGFKKIILYNFHGGNRNILPLLLQNHLTKKNIDYTLYMPEFDWVVDDVIKKYCTSEFGGHADEWETSLMLHLFPELVKMERVPPRSTGRPLKRLEDLRKRNTHTPVDFYSNFPTHYAGEAEYASPETGARAVKDIVDRLAKVIRAVKKDKVTPKLLREFKKAMSAPDDSES